MSGTLIETPLDDLKQKCPAFENGCPYASPELKELVSGVKECPEFKGSCPFRDSVSLADVYEKISKVSNVELADNHEQGLVQLINSIHSISKNLSGSVGECPVFSTEAGCPFKTMCTDGTPLVSKLDALNWGKVVDESLESIVHSIALSKEFKTGTKKVHREAERVHFVRAFLKGNVDEKLYRAFVASLYFIYQALEKESQRCADHPMFKEIHFPEQLDRVESLEQDLQYFYGDDWKEEISMSDVVTEYVDHIHHIAEKDPALMIAHHYTRYLGDLSGGQVLKKAAVKACQLPPNGEGVEFYEFRKIDSARDFKNMYRKKLDGILVSKEQADELVEEAKVAFVFNIKLFKELDVLGGFMEEIVHETVEPTDTAKSDVCPFIVTKKPTTKSDQPTSSGQCPISMAKNNSSRILLIVSIAVLALAVLFGFGVRPVGGSSIFGLNL